MDKSRVDRSVVTRHILILVENLPVPFDRRVWQESQALVDAGYAVTVICPMGVHADREPDLVLEGSAFCATPFGRLLETRWLHPRVRLGFVAHLASRHTRPPRRPHPCRTCL